MQSQAHKICHNIYLATLTWVFVFKPGTHSQICQCKCKCSVSSLQSCLWFILNVHSDVTIVKQSIVFYYSGGSPLMCRQFTRLARFLVSCSFDMTVIVRRSIKIKSDDTDPTHQTHHILFFLSLLNLNYQLILMKWSSKPAAYVIFKSLNQFEHISASVIFIVENVKILLGINLSLMLY